MNRFYFSKLIILLCLLLGANWRLFAQSSAFAFNGTGVGAAGTVQTYVVPTGCTHVGATLIGSAGGKPYNEGCALSNALGGLVQCVLNVSSGQSLYLYVGGMGGNDNGGTAAKGGWNGGGTGASYGSGSGGASDIRLSNVAVGTYSTTFGSAGYRIAVAGAGGAGGDFNAPGGAGGGTTGGSGGPANCLVTGGTGGSGGTQAAGGAGSAAGTLGVGGGLTGANYACGGGGYYGGGSGSSYAGGGGGSSYTDPTYVTLTPTNTQGYSGATGNGSITLCAYPGITTEPTASTIVCINGTFPTLTIVENAASAVTGRQWYYNGTTNSITGGTAIAGATGLSYSGCGGCGGPAAGSTAATGTYYYYCVSTNACGGQATTTAAVIVYPLATITTQPAATTSVCNLAAAPTLTISAPAGLTYQWYNNGSTNSNVGGTSVGSTSGGQTASYTGASTATVGTTYFYCVVSSPCGSIITSNVATVVVNPLPVITPTTPTAICSGATTAINLASITSVPSSYTWTLGLNTGSLGGTSPCSSSCGTTISQLLTNSGGSVGSIVYNVTPVSTTGSCLGSTVSLTQSVNPLPTLTSTTPATICSGSSTSIGLSASVPSSYTWTIGTITGGISGASLCNAACGSTISQVLTDASSSTPGSVIYVVTPTATTGGCVGTAGNVTQNVNPVPDVSSFAVVATSPCLGGGSTVTVTSSSLINAVPYTVTYTLSGLSGNTGTHTASMTFGSGSGTFTIAAGFLGNPGATTITVNSVAVIATTCSSSLVGGNIAGFNVNELPSPFTASATSNPSCVGNPVTLTGSATGASGVTYSWTGPVPGDIVAPASLSTSILSASLNDAGTYTLTATALGCGSATATTAVLAVNQLPSPFTASTSPNPICAASTFSLTAVATGAAGATYSWAGPVTADIASPTSLNTIIASAAASDAGSYTITATAAGCGSSIANTNAIPEVVNPQPVPTFLVHPATTLCGGSSATYTTQSSEASYIWNVSGTSGLDYVITSGGTSASNNSVTLTWVTSGPKTVTVNYTNGNGCTGAVAASYTTTVNTTPTAYTMTGGGTYCTGGVGVHVGLNGSDPGISYQLYVGINPVVGAVLPGTGSALDFGLQLTAGVYTAIGTNTLTACPTTMLDYVTVATTPPPNTYTLGYTTPGVTSYCAGGTGVSLTLSGSDNSVAYQLYSGVTPVGGLVTGTGSAINFGPQTVASGSVPFSVVANPGTGPGCATTMSGSPVITVNPLPGTIGGTLNVCAGLTTQLSDAGTGTWSSSTTAQATVNMSTGLATGVSAGSPILTYTFSSTGCYATTTLTVNPLPSAITGTTQVCAGLTTSLSDAGGGTWSSSNTFVATIGSSSGIVSGLLAAHTVITYTLPTGCIGVTTVTVNPLPGAISGNATICNGLSTTLSDAGGGTWSTANTQVTVGLNSGIVTGAAAGSSLVTYTLPATGCTNTLVVTVNPLPSSIVGTTSVCAGLTTSLSDAGGGSWSSSNSSVATINSSGLVSSVIAGNTGITYTLPVTGCITTTTVTVNPLPGAISGNTTICVNSTTTLSDAGGGTWSSGNTLQATAGLATGVVTGVAAGSPAITYTLPVTGCIATQSVTINPLPNPIGGILGVCIGLTTTLSDAGGGTWSSSNPLVASIGSSSGIVSGFMTGNTGITYTLPGTGCAITATVTVNSLPSAITGGPATICLGTTTSLSDASIGGAWSSSNTLQASVSSSGLVTPVSPGAPVITYALGTGCTSTTTITVNALPTVSSITATPGTSYCTGGVMTLNAGTKTGTGTFTSYNWSGPNAYGATSATNTTSLTLGTTLASGTYSVSVTYAGIGCTSANAALPIPITVLQAPSLTSATNSSPVCVGSSLTLNANGAANITGYSWAGPVAITSGAGTATATVSSTTLASAGIYTVAVNNGAGTGCSVNYTTTAIVNSLPTVVTVTGSGGPFCGSTTLSASNGGSGTIYFQGVTSNGTSTLTPSVSQIVSAVGTTTFYFNALSAGGCWGPQGSATVTIDALPTAYAITGGGSYCSGGTGVTVGLNGSQNGVSYQLYNGVSTSGSPVAGNGGAISFGIKTIAGSYTAVATNTVTACTNNMTGSTTIAVSPVPSAYVVIGGGSYCSGGNGVTVGLNGSDAGVSYQLYDNGLPAGSMITGTGSAISFGLQTAVGSYSVVANPAATCALNMTGGVTISVNTLPTAYTVTGTGSYCPGSSGVYVGLSNSQTSTTYQLYNSGVVDGSPVTGTGFPINFGLQTAGTYTVVATNTATTCVNEMSGSAVVTTSPIPTAFDVTGGGSYCSGGTGVHIGLNNSTTGVNYQLYTTSGTTGPIMGGTTGSAIDFGLVTAAATYSVLATNATTFCTSVMNDTAVVTVGSSPNLYTVVGGGTECANGLGFDLGLNGSDIGVTYQLYNGSGAVGGLVAGTGHALDMGLQTAAGTYSVVADPGTTCGLNMTGTASIIQTPIPTAYDVIGGGVYCAGGSGFDIMLNGSDIGVTYQLYNGSVPVGSPKSGTSSSLDFGIQVNAGTYKVIATNTTTACTNTMADSAVIIMHPVAAIHHLSGGGSYCAGGTGVDIALNGSEVGVTYQLYIGTIPIDTVFNGTGLPIDFGLQTTPGQYAAVANPATTCATTMDDSVLVTVNPLPTLYSVTGGGGYCAGSLGLHVGLSGSNTGISYQLYNGSTIEGSPVTGNGSAIDFGLQIAAGTYTVLATNIITGCDVTMSGNAVITVNPLPTVYTVTGGGGYCAGGTGVHIGLSGSTLGVKYQLYIGGVMVGISITGTGSALDFGPFTLGGTYTVIATNATTLCTNNMSGSAIVVVDPLPTAYTVSGGGQYCFGSAAPHIDVSNSAIGISYQLYNAGGAVGLPVTGTGSLLDLGAVATAGTYTVVATNNTTGCQNTMTGTATITVNPLPNVYAVTGGGNYCAGGTGVLVGVSNSTSGVSYQLFNGAGAVGTPTVSVGGALSFGLQTVAGTYLVVATTASPAGCSVNMTGTATVTINALPTAYIVSGTGSYCAGSAAPHVMLSSSATGVNYQLYNGSSVVGTAVPGNGFSIDFGAQATAGTYTVLATNTITGCTNGMASSATITVNPLPTLYAVTGGGNYCAGGTGVHIGLNNSTAGISYQLYNGTSAVGSPTVSVGGAIDFGLQTAAGTYSVIATNTTTFCTATMSGNATVVIDPLPLVYAVSGGGTYCAGGTGFHIIVSGSNLGINYQLYNGSSMVNGPVPGTGSLLDMGLQTAAGAYTVVATNATTGCTSNMTGSATITVNPLPTVYSVTGGGSYCSGGTGVHIGVSNSTLGINYELYNGAVPVTSHAGSGSAIDFGLQTAAGTYTVVATNGITGCPVAMSGFATVTINPLPNVYTVSGTGSYCAGGTGVDVSQNGGDNGINYQLYRGATPVGVLQTGSGPIDFGLQTVAGVYTVIGSNAITGCSSDMAGNATITINPLPTVFTITGGGSYCQGGSGVHVGLGSSAVGVNYQLWNGSSLVGSLSGTTHALDFGLQTAAGTYTVIATNTFTSCSDAMSGVATVSINPLPTQYVLSNGGTYCSNQSGIDITLSNSTAGTNYQLYNGATPVGIALPGGASPLDFGLQTAAGTYTVLATNTATTCMNGMTGSAVISVNPAPNIYPVTGGGSYCQGGNGVHIGLTNSTAGISYQLFYGGAAVGSPTVSTGGALDFGLQTAAGTYTVAATNNSTSCMANMSGSATVTINPLPTVYTILGAASSYCAGGTGVDLQMTGSQVGVNYQLMNGSALSGFPYAGTGSPLDFGLQTVAGTYIVFATNSATSCTNYMASSASISINPLPTVYTVTGGGGYCAGTPGTHIGLSGSNSGINYTLYLGSVSIATIHGTGSAIDFGLQTTVGNYSVVATNTISTCTNDMSGSVTVSINPLPAPYAVTGGGNYCVSGSGVHVGLSGSAAGISYQLYDGALPIGVALAGTGHALDFGLQTDTGTYTIIASNTLTTCVNTMIGSVKVGLNPLPAVYTLTGGGDYCSGGTGVGITLMGSSTGIRYQLYNGSTSVGATQNGTGSSLSFGLQTAAGAYIVVATDTTTLCSVDMSGTDTVVVDPLPVAYNVTGGGSYCAGGSGVHVTMSNSQIGVNYQLYNGSSTVGFYVAGTGTLLDFGLQTAAGTYTVGATNATTGCVNNMAGSTVIMINPLLNTSVTISTGMGDSVCSGVMTTLTALTVNGGSSPVYQWQVNGIPTGIVTGSYSYVPNNGDVVTVTMTSNATCATPATQSASINLSVLPFGMPAVSIAANPGSTVCVGSVATFSATPTFGGADPGYTWLIHGTPVALSGATYSYVPTAGDVVFCMMTSDYPCRTSSDTTFSNAITMATDTPMLPSVVIAADPATSIAPGSALTLSAVVTNGGQTPAYQWYINGVAVSGATFSTFTSSNFVNQDSVTCVVTSGNACALSAFNSVIISVWSLGVTQIANANSDISLVPNPNKGQFTVKGSLSTTDDQEVTLEVTDMLGQSVYKNKVMTHGGVINEHIQLSNTLANGMYILNLLSSGETKVFHIVVEQ